mgnify:FL=1|jgi:hypothetical protein
MRKGRWASRNERRDQRARSPSPRTCLRRVHDWRTGVVQLLVLLLGSPGNRIGGAMAACGQGRRESDLTHSRLSRTLRFTVYGVSLIRPYTQG